MVLKYLFQFKWNLIFPCVLVYNIINHHKNRVFPSYDLIYLEYEIESILYLNIFHLLIYELFF